jgi:hypothetical protein
VGVVGEAAPRVEHQLVLIFEFRGKHVLRVRSYSDRSEALETAKLVS